MIRFLLLALCFLVLQSVSLVNAEEKDKPTTLSPRVYKKLKKIELQISKKSYQQAEQSLKALLTNVKQKTFGQATVLRSLSSVYALKGQYKNAAKTLSQCLALNVLPKSQELQAVLNLGQLYMAMEHYSKAISTLDPWIAQNPNPDAKINVLLANAYAQLKRYRKALPYIKKAISQSKKPQESWYQLNLALYFELQNYSSAAAILTKLIQLYPDKRAYWHQLSSVYQQLKQYKKAASIKYLAYKKGFIDTEKGVLELVNLMSYVGNPYKAATLLKNEIDQHKIKNTSNNWEILANTWTLAKEYNHAIKALKTASKLDNKGRLYKQLGQIYVEQEEWALAVPALNNAISKGGIKNAGSTHLLIGMSYYELKKLKQAKKSFLKAAKYNRSKKSAKQWLEYIKSHQTKASKISDRE